MGGGLLDPSQLGYYATMMAGSKVGLELAPRARANV
jgi:hypothetical protein